MINDSFINSELQSLSQPTSKLILSSRDGVTKAFRAPMSFSHIREALASIYYVSKGADFDNFKDDHVYYAGAYDEITGRILGEPSPVLLGTVFELVSFYADLIKSEEVN